MGAWGNINTVNGLKILQLLLRNCTVMKYYSANKKPLELARSELTVVLEQLPSIFRGAESCITD